MSAVSDDETDCARQAGSTRKSFPSSARRATCHTSAAAATSPLSGKARRPRSACLAKARKDGRPASASDHCRPATMCAPVESARPRRRHPAASSARNGQAYYHHAVPRSASNTPTPRYGGMHRALRKGVKTTTAFKARASKRFENKFPFPAKRVVLVSGLFRHPACWTCRCLEPAEPESRTA